LPFAFAELYAPFVAYPARRKSMSIACECTCGKSFKAKDSKAGKRVQCPACGKAVRVPDEEAEVSAGYGMEAYRKCPHCKREWPEETVVCVECGYNFETGKRMRTEVDVADRVIDAGVTWLGTYTRLVISNQGKSGPLLTVSSRFLFIPLGSRQ